MAYCAAPANHPPGNDVRILLSNDDGYLATGLKCLDMELRAFAEVTVVAPELNHSGASNSLTLDNPIRAKQGDNGFICVDGTPTDCVHLAITGLLDVEPDMVVAGINAGANLGDDVLYSGTVAAAWKGSVSIHAEADEDRPELIAAMEGLVAKVATSVVGGTVPPQIIDLLPRAGLVPWSERIVAEDLMNHAFLPGGVLATYRLEGDEGTVFFSDLASEAAVTEAMAELRAHHEQWSEIVGDIDSIGDGGFRFSDPGLGSGAVVSTGVYVVGVHGDLPSDVQMDLLGRLVKSLSSALTE